MDIFLADSKHSKGQSFKRFYVIYIQYGIRHNESDKSFEL